MAGFLFVFSLSISARWRLSPLCPHCKYPYTFDDADAPIRCPECGAVWLGILKKGRTKWFFKRTLIGTALLYASNYLTPFMSDLGWDELATRKLGPYWTTLIAKRVNGFCQYSCSQPGGVLFSG